VCTATETNFTFLPSIRQEETREKAWKVVPNWGVPKGVGGVWELCESFSAVGKGASSVHCEEEELERERQPTLRRLSKCARRWRRRRRRRKRGKRRACGSLRLCTAHATPLP
jgi:hypothetical protein